MGDELSTRARMLPLLAWFGGLAAVLAGALALGRLPALAAPPLGRPGAWVGWAVGREPLHAAFAVLRVLVVALACYLLVVTVLAVLLRLGAGAERLVTAVDVLTLPWVRGVVHGAVGVGLVGAALAAVGSTTADRAGPGSTSIAAADAGAPLVRPDVPVAGSDLLVRLPEIEPKPPSMRRLATGPVISEPAAAPAEGAGHPAAADIDGLGDAGEVVDRRIEPPLGSTSGSGVTELALGAGDHLWAVAERTLASAWGSAPSDAQVTSYWRALVEANQARLLDPANPDLVFPGQVLALPATPLPE